MTNSSLAKDYIFRAHGRRKAVQTLFDGGLYADVVRECQESLELALKALVREAGHVVPRSHDVSDSLSMIAGDVSPAISALIPRFSQISKKMRRDRELAFYGSEDITPSQFYDKAAAVAALAELDEVLAALPISMFK